MSTWLRIGILLIVIDIHFIFQDAEHTDYSPYPNAIIFRSIGGLIMRE